MKTMMIVLSAAALLGCGDNIKLNADAAHRDSAAPDASLCAGCPALPTLGAQIDRLGRPAVNTVLDHGFDSVATTAGPAKDAYNADGDSTKASWPATYTAQFMLNLAFVDALDEGLTCVDGACAAGGRCSLTTTKQCRLATPADCPATETCIQTAGDGCGNQTLYHAPASATSYQALAGTLADDELFLDTTKTSCEIATTHQNYLAVEVSVVTGGAVMNTTCGGRAPTNDVIDTSYTALSIGLGGFKASDGTFAAAFGDGIGPHALGDGTDANNVTFPFLGKCHGC